jgi:hypothetical protein
MHRRSFLTGLGALVAAPAVVQFASLMPVRGIIMPTRIIVVIKYAGMVGGPLRIEREFPADDAVWWLSPHEAVRYVSG